MESDADRNAERVRRYEALRKMRREREELLSQMTDRELLREILYQIQGLHDSRFPRPPL